MSEQVFDVPYALPSGRIARLRGKWDLVDYLPAHKENGIQFPAGVWLMENKSKGTVEKVQLLRQLTFDIQTMMYLVALHRSRKLFDVACFPSDPDSAFRLNGTKDPIVGIRYNAVKRPLSGGKGTIKRSEGTKGSKCPKCKEAKVVKASQFSSQMIQCPKCGGVGRINAKPEESKEEFYGRLAQYMKDEPHEWFFRWKVPVAQSDVSKFERTFLVPILEQLCDWWEWISAEPKDPFALNTTYFPGRYIALHWRHPFGVYNVLDEGGSSEYDEYLATGSEQTLVRADELFHELR
jgi:hypothetical protein